MRRVPTLLALTIALTACTEAPLPTATRVVASDVAGTLALTDGWVTLAPMATVRKMHAAALGTDGRVYAIGGLSTAFGLDAGAEAYDVGGNTWAPTATPGFLYGAGAATSGGSIYLVGGFNGSVITTAVAVYDVASGTWSAGPSLGSARFDHTVVADAAGRIYAIGGNGAAQGTAERLDPATGTWSAIAALNEARVASAAVLGPNGKLYLFGGVYSDFPNLDFRTSVEAFDPATGAWTVVSTMPRARSGLAAAVGSDGKIYLMGGSNPTDGMLSVVDVFDPVTGGWTTGPALTAPRRTARAVAAGNMIFLMGGEGASGFSVATVEALSVAAAPPTPEAATQVLASSIDDLVSGGAISTATAGPLQSTLAAAVASLASGQTTAAAGQLGSFVNKVQAAVRSGRMSAATGATLTAAANAIIDSID